MTTRTDINVDFNVGPRIIEVEEPSEDVTMQDLVDTLRIVEEGFTLGLAFPKVTNASGKDDLGGGVSVGITTSLQNAKLAFEARRTPAETGAVTTGSIAPVVGNITFIDSNADFTAAGVVRGSLVINFSDLSVADVFSVDSDTQLTTRVLVNGSTNTYQIGDVYHVFNIIQCNVAGGNLVALDEFGDPIDPILPTAFTQVVRTSSSSATIQNQESLEFFSYSEQITVDLTSSFSGTTFPVGTLQQPVNNFADALTIGTNLGLDTLKVIGDATINGGLDFSNRKFIGQGGNLTTFTVQAAATVTNASFRNATITGTMDGNATLESCIIEDLSVITGLVRDCLLIGTITLSGSEDAVFVSCSSGETGSLDPIVDCGGAGGPDFAFRDWFGGIDFRNIVDSDGSMDMSSGSIILNANCSGGTIELRGVGNLTDNSTGTAVDALNLIQGSFLLTVAKFLGLK